MHTKIAIVIAGLLTSTILALPQGSPTCQTVYPTIVARISQAQPSASLLPGFTISQEADASNKQDVLVEFDIPAGSYGCQLEAFFPAGYSIQSSGETLVYVYSTDKNPSRDVTWATAPAPVSQVGTIEFASDPSKPTTEVINSFVCQPETTYRLSIGRDFTAAGSVSFAQTVGAGLRITHNC